MGEGAKTGIVPTVVTRIVAPTNKNFENAKFLVESSKISWWSWVQDFSFRAGLFECTVTQ